MTNEQEMLFQAASKSYMMTDDPFVNYKVDMHTSDEFWKYDEAHYLQDLEAWRKSGGFTLTYVKE